MPERWLAKAEENIEAATVCLENGFYNASVNRCYYAMFHVAIAVLIKFGVKARGGKWGHSYVQAAFSTNLIKRRKILSSSLSGDLLEVMGHRHIADYSTRLISKKEAERILRRGRTFVNTVKEIIK